MSNRGHIPVRMCTICRQRYNKPDITRFVSSESGLIEDSKKRLPGRGIYICSSSKCMDKAKKRWTII